MYSKKAVLPGTKFELDQGHTYLVSLIRFHHWRQEIIGNKLKGIDTELLNKQIPGSFGSLFIILKHLVWAEKVWYSRANPESSAVMAESVGDVNSLVEEWNKITTKWVDLVESKADLTEKVVYFNTIGQEFTTPLDEIIVHLVDHSTYHVGQIMNTIRAFDLEPVSTNYIHYLRSLRIKEN